jgi:hypothetical protein
LRRGTSVAVLILIRPGVQVNAVESDTLRANGNDREMWTHVAIETILVHAQIRRRIAQSDEAREELHKRPLRLCGSDRSGTSCHSVFIIPARDKNVRHGFGVILPETPAASWQEWIAAIVTLRRV